MTNNLILAISSGFKLNSNLKKLFQSSKLLLLTLKKKMK